MKPTRTAVFILGLASSLYSAFAAAPVSPQLSQLNRDREQQQAKINTDFAHQFTLLQIKRSQCPAHSQLESGILAQLEVLRQQRDANLRKLDLDYRHKKIVLRAQTHPGRPSPSPAAPDFVGNAGLNTTPKPYPSASSGLSGLFSIGISHHSH